MKRAYRILGLLPLLLTCVVCPEAASAARKARVRRPAPMAAPAATPEPARPLPIQMNAPRPIMLDPSTGGGEGYVVLVNPAASPAKALLSAGTVFSTATEQETKASVTFSGVDGADASSVYAVSVPPGEPLPLRVSISGLNEAGEVSVELLNYGEPLKEKLRALNFRFPFSVKVAPESQPLRLAPETPSQLVLVNDDDVPYPVEWRLLVGGRPLVTSSGEKDFNASRLAAKGTTLLRISPPSSFFSDAGNQLSSLFREETQDAILEIRPKLRDGLDNGFLPIKGIPLKVRLGYWSPMGQQLVGTLVVFAVLLAGGVISLVLSYLLPNLLRRRDIKDRLQALEASAGGITDRIDSGLRVLMRVERRRLKELLKDVPVMSPDMGRVFTQCEQGIALLESRLSLIEEIDIIYDRLSAAQALCPPPSLKDRVEQNLWKAAALLSEPNPVDADFQAARNLIAEARAGTERLNLGDEEFKKDLAQRIKELYEDIYHGGNETLTGKLADLYNLLPGPFEIPKRYKDREVPPGMFATVDVNLSALSMLRDYAQIYEGTQVGAVRVKLDAHEPELLGLLSLQSSASLRNARLLLRQMKEGLYASEVLDVIRSGEVYFEVTPQIQRPFEPARFSIRFQQLDIDVSAARDQFQCEWVFDETYEERGWSITHFFAKAGEHKVRALFIAPDGQQVTTTDSAEKRALERTMVVAGDRVSGKWDRLMAESVRLMIALFIALLGLITGAQDQLSKMDFIPGMITIFLLGFSADAIKNLLTQRTQPPA